MHFSNSQLTIVQLVLQQQKISAQADENLFNFQLDNWKTTRTQWAKREEVMATILLQLLVQAVPSDSGTMN